ncbi:MAG: hypothetical protein EWV76_09930 [Microcystis novacekii Mn_MB_F_20050700_S1]|uniref:CopG family transcriptional regulator n=1 Tax=Microcystis novacekii Mn_MB_F_20050700_S1D TaxID=2486266 RepID=A0A552J072_9CHRO|nr:MAG: hypothetical protein EWV76_09930 [Microcystis novacekii Mn_MB_F_20050700_S1]TRU89148.1 MAG: hypothetical protein EWV54_09030 [Microcystis novacekii Mn_MB_F_20050700_S1D]
MKGNSMNKPEDEYSLKLHPRLEETISLALPKDTLAAIKKVAANRDMSYEALLKLYIGQGLRQDLTKMFSNRILETTAQVLAKHIDSEAEISSIIEEILAQTTYH